MWILTRAGALLPLINHPQRLRHLQISREKHQGKEQEVVFYLQDYKMWMSLESETFQMSQKRLWRWKQPWWPHRNARKGHSQSCPCMSMVNTRWEYGKVTRALLDFTPLTHKWERSKGCWFNCIISWDWFFHTWGLNSHCVCKTLYFCTFFSAFFTEGRSTIFVNFQDLWQPGLLSIQTWTPSPVLLETTGKNTTLFELLL